MHSFVSDATRQFGKRAIDDFEKNTEIYDLAVGEERITRFIYELGE